MSANFNISVEKEIIRYLKQKLDDGKWNSDVFEILKEVTNVKPKYNNHKDELEDLINPSDPKIITFYILNHHLISNNGVLREAKQNLGEHLKGNRVYSFTQDTSGIIPLSSIPERTLEITEKYIKTGIKQINLDNFF